MAEPLCWGCEYIHYEIHRAAPQCRKRWLRLEQLPTRAEGCADFAPRTWGRVYCPACLGTGAEGILHVTDGTGTYYAVCSHDPTHRWALHHSRANMDRCPACGGFFMVLDYTPLVPLPHAVVFALCPHCSVGQVTTPRRGRSQLRPPPAISRTV